MAFHAGAGGVDQQDRPRPPLSASPSDRPASNWLATMGLSAFAKHRRLVGMAIENMDLRRAQFIQAPGRRPAPRRPRPAAPRFCRLEIRPDLSRMDSRRPTMSVLRASMRPSAWKIRRLAAPAAFAASSLWSASAKAASLCGTVTLTPRKPAQLQSLDHRERNLPARTASGTSAPFTFIFAQPIAMQHRRQRNG